MPVAYEVPKIHVLSIPAPSVDADLVVVPVAEDHASAAVAEFDAAVGGSLGVALARGEFTPRALDSFTAPIVASGWTASRTDLHGRRQPGRHRTGAAAAHGGLRGFARAAAAARPHRVARRRARLDGAAHRADILGEGFTTANFDGGIHKSRPEPRYFLSDVTVVTAAAGAVAAAGAGRIIGDAINSARVLINEPGNLLVPARLAEKGASLASVEGVSVDVFDERKLETMGMGLLLGVGRGSAEPPRMLIARYEPADAPTDVTLGLVGKGDHLRHRRHFDQAGRRHGADEGRHGRRRHRRCGAARRWRCCACPLRAIAVVPRPRTCPAGAR